LLFLKHLTIANLLTSQNPDKNFLSSWTSVLWTIELAETNQPFTMKSFRIFRGLPMIPCLSFLLCDGAEAFTHQSSGHRQHRETHLHGGRQKGCTELFSSAQKEPQSLQDRRSAVSNILAASALVTGSWGAQPETTYAAVGTLPEFSDTNAIIEGITVTVADKSQQDAMITFLIDSFEFKVLRQSVTGPMTDVVS
jgi:hypothetical protein